MIEVTNEQRSTAWDIQSIRSSLLNAAPPQKHTILSIKRNHNDIETQPHTSEQNPDVPERKSQRRTNFQQQTYTEETLSELQLVSNAITQQLDDNIKPIITPILLNKLTELYEFDRIDLRKDLRNGIKVAHKSTDVPLGIYELFFNKNIIALRNTIYYATKDIPNTSETEQANYPQAK